jgi:hypothetical protein
MPVAEGTYIETCQAGSDAGVFCDAGRCAGLDPRSERAWKRRLGRSCRARIAPRTRARRCLVRTASVRVAARYGRGRMLEKGISAERSEKQS